MAPSKKIYLAVLEKLEGFMRYHTTLRSNSIVDDVNAADDDDADVEGVDNADAHMSLVEFPVDAGIFELCMWVFLFPIRFIMHWTLPDVRHMDSDGDFTPSINTAFFSTFMCLVWLVIGSYAMVASLEGLAELMDIPDAVIGFTVSAAGECVKKDPEPSNDLVSQSSHNVHPFSRYFASQLRGQQGRSGEWIWKPGCFQRFWFQHI